MTHQRPLPPNPSFLIIGAQKSGTRWLRTNLGHHPDIYTASEELHYFNRPGRMRRIGLEGYRAQFERWNGEPVVGEATPGYMIWRHDPTMVAKRIAISLPDVRLIAILRNPVDRAQSALLHHQKRRRVSSRTTLVKHVKKRDPETDRLGVISGGWYAASLRPFLRRFGDRLLVLLHDDVQVRPEWVYRQAVLHIGGSPDFVPDQVGSVVFSNRPAGPPRSELSLEDRRLVYGYFEDDVKRLQRMLGRSLAVWHPNRAHVTAQPGSSAEPLT
jgi:hypothetical protein